MTSISAFTFAPETDAMGHNGVADNLPSAISGAWAMANHFQAFVVVKDHRDFPEGIEIMRIGIEWLDSIAASSRDYDEELDAVVR